MAYELDDLQVNMPRYDSPYLWTKSHGMLFDKGVFMKCCCE